MEMLPTLREWLKSLALEGYLPELLQHGFVINALIATCLLGPLLGGLGTLVVVKRFAFFSEAVGHAALTGVALGILFNEPYTSPFGSLFGYCLLFGLFLNYMRNRTGLSPDTLIGVFLSTSLALGSCILLILATKINIHIIDNILFGSVLTIIDQDIYVLLCIFILTLIVITPIYNQLMISSFNSQIATVRKIPAKLLDYIFVVIITSVSVASVKIIGAILVGALLVIPAATSRLLSRSMRSFFWYSVLIATISTLLGIIIPLQWDIPAPSGGAIILMAGIIFCLVTLFKFIFRIRS